jgi:hypothetical protein
MPKGTRLPDSVYPAVPKNAGPLDYWKWLSAPGVPMVAARHHWFENGGHNVPHTCWGVCAPDGDFRFVQDITVREETDGTISVVQGDGGWDNKLVYGTPGTAQYWEGWLNHGDWVAA